MAHPKVNELAKANTPEPEGEITTAPPRIVSNMTASELARQKAEDFVKSIASEGLAALERLRQEVDNGTFAIQEQQAELTREIAEFYHFTADTLNAVKVMESAMMDITKHFKPEK